jgi:hypothetical protein
MSAAGLLVRYRGELAFIPASVARFIRYDVVVTSFPGTDLGMALLTGRIVPVIALGPAGRALVVCDIDGETIAFCGIEPQKSGFFDGDERGPIESNVVVPTLPIRDFVEQARRQRPTPTERAEENSWMS